MVKLTLLTKNKISINGDLLICIFDNILEIPILKIKKISIITTENGPFVDDVFLVLFLEHQTITIPPEHPCFQPFLFDQLPQKVGINYEQLAKSMSSCINAEFVLFSR
jgi:hypothetical protein